MGFWAPSTTSHALGRRQAVDSAQLATGKEWVPCPCSTVGEGPMVLAGQSTSLRKAWKTAQLRLSHKACGNPQHLDWSAFVQGSALGVSVPGTVLSELLVTTCIWVSLCFGRGWRAWTAQWAGIAPRWRGPIWAHGRNAGLEERPVPPRHWRGSRQGAPPKACRLHVSHVGAWPPSTCVGRDLHPTDREAQCRVPQVTQAPVLGASGVPGAGAVCMVALSRLLTLVWGVHSVA